MKDLTGIAWLLLLVLWLLAAVVQIYTRISEHREIMKTQAIMQAEKPAPFEATGWIASRLDDDRILLTFTRPHPTIKDRQFVTEVILSPKDFNYVTTYLSMREKEWGSK